MEEDDVGEGTHNLCSDCQGMTMFCCEENGRLLLKMTKLLTILHKQSSFFASSCGCPPLLQCYPEARMAGRLTGLSHAAALSWKVLQDFCPEAFVPVQRMTAQDTRIL